MLQLLEISLFCCVLLSLFVLLSVTLVIVCFELIVCLQSSLYSSCFLSEVHSDV